VNRAANYIYSNKPWIAFELGYSFSN